jgi:3-hydroxyisobutyrate dehydrogenase-like beta-hydroxyacid dehydrogenase
VTSGKQRIGFIGVGMMGHGMAKNLVEKGFATAVLGHNNRAPVEDLVKRGAREAKHAADAASGADIVFLCVSGSPQVEEIVYGANGLLSAARKGLFIVDCSTSEPDSTARIAKDFAAKGVSFIDAPLARTPKEAEEGRLNVMVGAAPADFAAIEPALKAFGENVFHVGGPGAGHKLKLLNNFLAMGYAALIAEGLAVGAKVGVDLEALFKVVSVGGANSGIFQLLVPKALKGDYTGLPFILALAQKDMRYYTHMAEAAGMTSYFGEMIHQTLTQANNMGFGAKMVGSLIEMQEKIHAVRVAAASAKT